MYTVVLYFYNKELKILSMPYNDLLHMVQNENIIILPMAYSNIQFKIYGSTK